MKEKDCYLSVSQLPAIYNEQKLVLDSSLMMGISKFSSYFNKYFTDLTVRFKTRQSILPSEWSMPRSFILYCMCPVEYLS